MPDTFTVAAAQRRLLEAIAGYQSDMPFRDQQELRGLVASNVLDVAAVAEPVDAGVSAIYAALSELMCAVTIEQIAGAVV